jgi:hypothetical protein
MPVHDWTRVDAGIFHAFHQAWIVHLSERLNAGILPADYYALPDQVAGPVGPDVLTLQAASIGGGSGPGGALVTSPPQVRFTGTLGALRTRRRRPGTLLIRHVSNDRVVALIEVVSPGNKSSQNALRAFVEKVTTLLSRGVHLLVIDLFPPGPRDPNGLPGAISHEYGEPPPRLPQGQPLTLASYAAGVPTTLYVETVGVGDMLPEMPLFLLPGRYVPVPLEETYQQSWSGVPRRWRDVLEAPAMP